MANVGQNIQMTVGQTFTPTGLPGTVTPFSQNVSYKFNPGVGAGADLINEIMVPTTLSFAASPQVLDLRALVDPGGATFLFARIKSIGVNFRSITDGQILLMGYATTTANAWVGLLSNPGQITFQAATASNNAMLWMTAPNATGWVVTSGSHLLQFDPGAYTFMADVYISGCLT